MQTDHERYLIHLPDYVTGNLAPGVGRDVEAHLASCDSCRGQLADLESLMTQMGAHRPGRVPANYFGTVLPRIRKRLEGRRETGENPWVTRILAPLSALALIIVLTTQISFDANEDLRSVVGSLETDELNEAIVDEVQWQSSYLVPSTESLAEGLTEQAVNQELAAAVFNGEDVVGYETVADLSEREIELIVARLSERTIL